MAMLKILWLFLLVLQCGRVVESQEQTTQVMDQVKDEPFDTLELISNENNSNETYVDAKNINGNLELETLKVISARESQNTESNTHIGPIVTAAEETTTEAVSSPSSLSGVSMELFNIEKVETSRINSSDVSNNTNTDDSEEQGMHEKSLPETGNIYLGITENFDAISTAANIDDVVVDSETLGKLNGEEVSTLVYFDDTTDLGIVTLTSYSEAEKADAYTELNMVDFHEESTYSAQVTEESSSFFATNEQTNETNEHILEETITSGTEELALQVKTAILIDDEEVTTASHQNSNAIFIEDTSYSTNDKKAKDDVDFPESAVFLEMQEFSNKSEIRKEIALLENLNQSNPEVTTEVHYLDLGTKEEVEENFSSILSMNIEAITQADNEFAAPNEENTTYVPKTSEEFSSTTSPKQLIGDGLGEAAESSSVSELMFEINEDEEDPISTTPLKSLIDNVETNVHQSQADEESSSTFKKIDECNEHISEEIEATEKADAYTELNMDFREESTDSPQVTEKSSSFFATNEQANEINEHILEENITAETEEIALSVKTANVINDEEVTTDSHQNLNGTFIKDKPFSTYHKVANDAADLTEAARFFEMQEFSNKSEIRKEITLLENLNQSNPEVATEIHYLDLATTEEVEENFSSVPFNIIEATTQARNELAELKEENARNEPKTSEEFSSTIFPKQLMDDGLANTVVESSSIFELLYGEHEDEEANISTTSLNFLIVNDKVKTNVHESKADEESSSLPSTSEKIDEYNEHISEKIDATTSSKQFIDNKEMEKIIAIRNKENSTASEQVYENNEDIVGENMTTTSLKRIIQNGELEKSIGEYLTTQKTSSSPGKIDVTEKTTANPEIYHSNEDVEEGTETHHVNFETIGDVQENAHSKTLENTIPTERTYESNYIDETPSTVIPKQLVDDGLDTTVSISEKMNENHEDEEETGPTTSLNFIIGNKRAKTNVDLSEPFKVPSSTSELYLEPKEQVSNETEVATSSEQFTDNFDGIKKTTVTRNYEDFTEKTYDTNEDIVGETMSTTSSKRLIVNDELEESVINEYPTTEKVASTSQKNYEIIVDVDEETTTRSEEYISYGNKDVEQTSSTFGVIYENKEDVVDVKMTAPTTEELEPTENDVTEENLTMERHFYVEETTYKFNESEEGSPSTISADVSSDDALIETENFNQSGNSSLSEETTQTFKSTIDPAETTEDIKINLTSTPRIQVSDEDNSVHFNDDGTVLWPGEGWENSPELEAIKAQQSAYEVSQKISTQIPFRYWPLKAEKEQKDVGAIQWTIDDNDADDDDSEAQVATTTDYILLNNRKASTENIFFSGTKVKKTMEEYVTTTEQTKDDVLKGEELLEKEEIRDNLIKEIEDVIGELLVEHQNRISSHKESQEYENSNSSKSKFGIYSEENNLDETDIGPLRNTELSDDDLLENQQESEDINEDEISKDDQVEPTLQSLENDIPNTTGVAVDVGVENSEEEFDHKILSTTSATNDFELVHFDSGNTFEPQPLVSLNLVLETTTTEHISDVEDLTSFLKIDNDFLDKATEHNKILQTTSIYDRDDIEDLSSILTFDPTAIETSTSKDYTTEEPDYTWKFITNRNKEMHESETDTEPITNRILESTVYEEISTTLTLDHMPIETTTNTIVKESQAANAVSTETSTINSEDSSEPNTVTEDKRTENYFAPIPVTVLNQNMFTTTENQRYYQTQDVFKSRMVTELITQDFGNIETTPGIEDITDNLSDFITTGKSLGNLDFIPKGSDKDGDKWSSLVTDFTTSIENTEFDDTTSATNLRAFTNEEGHDDDKKTEDYLTISTSVDKNVTEDVSSKFVLTNKELSTENHSIKTSSSITTTTEKLAIVYPSGSDKGITNHFNSGKERDEENVEVSYYGSEKSLIEILTKDDLAPRAPVEFPEGVGLGQVLFLGNINNNTVKNMTDLSPLIDFLSMKYMKKSSEISPDDISLENSKDIDNKNTEPPLEFPSYEDEIIILSPDSVENFLLEINAPIELSSDTEKSVLKNILIMKNGTHVEPNDAFANVGQEEQGHDGLEKHNGDMVDQTTAMSFLADKDVEETNISKIDYLDRKVKKVENISDVKNFEDAAGHNYLKNGSSTIYNLSIADTERHSSADIADIHNIDDAESSSKKNQERLNEESDENTLEPEGIPVDEGKQLKNEEIANQKTTSESEEDSDLNYFIDFYEDYSSEQKESFHFDQEHRSPIEDSAESHESDDDYKDQLHPVISSTESVNEKVENNKNSYPTVQNASNEELVSIVRNKSEDRVKDLVIESEEDNENSILSLLYNEMGSIFSFPFGGYPDSDYVEAGENSSKEIDMEYDVHETDEDFYARTEITTVIAIEEKSSEEDEFMITGNMFLKTDNISAKIMKDNTSFYIPSDAYLKEDENKNQVNITWKSPYSSVINNSLVLNVTRGIRGNSIEGVQLQIVRDSEMLVMKKNVVITPPQHDNKLEGGDSTVIRLDDGFQIYLSNIDFLRASESNSFDERTEKTSDLKPTSEDQTKMVNIEIAVGCLALVIIIATTLYLVIRKSRDVKLDKKNPHEADRMLV